MAMANIEALAISRGITSTTALVEQCSVRQASMLSSYKSLPTGASSSLLPSPFFCPVSPFRRKFAALHGQKSKPLRVQMSNTLVGADPEWSDDDYIVLGLAHCFQQDEEGKLADVFLVEPVSASTVECLENGGATSYLHVTSSTLGTAFKYDVSLLPPEFTTGKFCDEFDFRAKCSARTWKRPHAEKNIKHIVPSGSCRSDYNFSLNDKRVINKERVVNDSDNIKQDMSIDVYGRSEEKKDEVTSEIASLYNA